MLNIISLAGRDYFPRPGSCGTGRGDAPLCRFSPADTQRAERAAGFCRSPAWLGGMLASVRQRTWHHSGAVALMVRGAL